MIECITSRLRQSTFSMSGSEESEASIAVLKVIIQSAHIAGSRRWWKRPPKPFVSIRVDNAQAAETGTQPETFDPSWITQTFFLLVKSPTEELRLIVHDHNAYRGRGLLGAASFDVSRLLESGTALDAQLPLLKEHKQTGDLLCSLFYYPISASADNENTIGVVHLVIHRAEGLQSSHAHSRCLNVMAGVRLRLDWDAPPIHVTPPRNILANGTVVWESMHEFLCFNKSTCVLYLDVSDPNLEDPVLGHLSICLTDLVEGSIAKRGPWALSGSATGKLVASAEWRPLICAPGS